MNTIKTLLILTPGFPADEADSTCLPFIQLFVKACKENHPALKIVVLSFQYPFRSGTYIWNGITVNSFNGQNKGKLNRLIVWRKVWKGMNTIRKENDIIGVLSFWLGECALVGSHFSKKNRLKHLTWILGQDARKNNRYQKLINPDAGSLVALSDSLAAEYLKNYRIVPANIVPVGIDTTLFKGGKLIRDIDVMGAGSFIPLKRYDLFIEVIQQVVRYIPKLSAVICGKGPEKFKLLSLVNKAGLKNNIAIVGELPYHVVLQHMERSKVFLHTSEYEGYSVACVEAMYAGAHVVSFCRPMNVSSPHEHIVETKEEAFKTIMEILNDPKMEHEPTLHYSIGEISKKMVNLFTV